MKSLDTALSAMEGLRRSFLLGGLASGTLFVMAKDCDWQIVDKQTKETVARGGCDKE